MTSYACQKFTWILQFLDNFINIDGYKLIRADHPDNIKIGGVCIYYKQPLWRDTVNIDSRLNLQVK